MLTPFILLLRLRCDFREREKGRGDVGTGNTVVLDGFVDGLSGSDVVITRVGTKAAAEEVSGSKGGGEGDSESRLEVENFGLSVITETEYFVLRGKMPKTGRLL